MSDPEASPSDRYSLAALLRPPALARLALIGAVAVAGAGAFAWAGGLLSPGRLTQSVIIDTFEAGDGPHPGFRRNHAKGLCMTGWFDGSGAASAYSRASVFARGRTPVTGRFALAGGMPRVPDSPGAVRSLALDFALADGEHWRTGMVDIPVFPVKDPQGFRDQLVATRPLPATGQPDPAALKAFVTAHPEAIKAIGMIKAQTFSSGFADARYNALNAFFLVGPGGRRTPVRWSMVPVDPFAPEPVTAPAGDNYLFEALAARLRRGPAQWRLELTLGEPGDPTSDASQTWPPDRPKVDAGLLTVTSVEPETAGNCRDINYDPLVLPQGIAPSADPLLSARSAAYSVSFTRRAGEPKSPSAVQLSARPAQEAR
ncbi:catalase family peroxidase [Caulobacter sp. KR2-114]|uniref:catalase family peroxidase n=1 Tax=Caulobacter sp. KR2-114 TaxID=3400912 RepID=UPI003C103087